MNALPHAFRDKIEIHRDPVRFLTPADPIKWLSGFHTINSPFRFRDSSDLAAESSHALICEIHPFFSADLTVRLKARSARFAYTVETSKALTLPRLPPYSFHAQRAIGAGAAFGAGTPNASAWLKWLGVDQRRLADFPIGNVDTESFGPNPRPGHGPCEILFAGRLERTKGFDVLVESLRTLAKTETFSLRVIGRGSLARLLDRDLGFRIRHDLFLSPRDYSDAFKTADIFCMPSVPLRHLGFTLWEEVYGVAAFEAMAAGLPVVASATGNLRELVAQGNALVPPGNQRQLRDALSVLIRDPERRATIGSKNREFAEARFSVKAVERRWRDLFQTIENG